MNCSQCSKDVGEVYREYFQSNSPPNYWQCWKCNDLICLLCFKEGKDDQQCSCGNIKY